MVVGVVALSSGGCVSLWDAPPKAGRATLTSNASPFAAVSLRVHPLTHIGTGKDGKPRLLAHIELRDRWGDATKGIGKLTLRLFGPLGGTGASQELTRWDVDLADLDLNATLFDPSTHTYRLQLAGVPEWLASMTPGNAASRSAKVVAQASLVSADTDKPLTDEHDLSR